MLDVRSDSAHNVITIKQTTETTTMTYLAALDIITEAICRDTATQRKTSFANLRAVAERAGMTWEARNEALNNLLYHGMISCDGSSYMATPHGMRVAREEWGLAV